MLEVADLHAYYGKSHILQGVDMQIGAGEVVSLLGRNGVGRSTTVKAIMGEVPPQGSIKFKGGDIAGLPSYRIAHLGLGYVPEHRDIFLQRAAKEALHEAGHLFGLVHCADHSCAMSLSTGVRQIDIKRPSLCGFCRGRLNPVRKVPIV